MKPFDENAIDMASFRIAAVARSMRLVFDEFNTLSCNKEIPQCERKAIETADLLCDILNDETDKLIQLMT